MGDVAASGGYYIATAADSIVADPQTITGSIGVFGVFFDAGGLFENKLGVTFDAVRTSPYADIFSGVRPLSDAERRLLESNVDQTYDHFLQRVADGRGMTVDEVNEIAQGRVWAGQDALDVGLVDTLGTLEDAVRIAAQKAGMGDGPYRIRSLPRMKTFFEQFNDALYTQASSAWMQMTTSPAERMLLKQRRTLQDLARMHGTVQARLPVDITVE
jgi:protease-4